MSEFGRIIQLQVADLGCIKFVNIGLDKDQNLVRIAGSNDAGKSTVINAIKYALEGAASIPQDVIRHGMYSEGQKAGKEIDRAYIRLETDAGYIIERVIRNNKKGEQVAELTVQKAGEGPIQSAQSFLNDISARFPDPSRVANLTSKDLFKAIIEIFNIDLAKFDNDINVAKTEAQYFRRRSKEIGLLEPPVVDPAIKDLLGEDPEEARQRLEDVRQTFPTLKAEAERLEYETESLQDRVGAKERESERIQEQISKLNDALEEVEKDIQVSTEELEKKIAHRDNLHKECSKLEPQFEAASKLESYFTAVKTYREWEEQATGIQQGMEALKGKISQLEADRIKAIAEAQLPNGLSLTEEMQVMKGEFNWDTLSDSEKLKTAVQLCCRSLPENSLRCLYFQRGESIGTEKRKIIAEEAAKNDVIVFMEVFTEHKIPEDGIIYIREGEIEKEEKKETKPAVSMDELF